MSLSPPSLLARLETAPAWSVDRHRAMPAAGATLADVVRALGFEPEADAGALAFPGLVTQRLRAGATLSREGQPAQALHVVRCGSFKCQRVSEDGYEQVLAFAGPGDVLGFEALHRGAHTTGAVALEDASVFVLPWAPLREARRQSAALDHALQVALSRQLARSAEMALMMAAVAAEVRLARFVLWAAERAAERGLSSTRLRLSMGRRDIASLLGVAHETVSRAFTTLADWGLLRVNNRDIEILDPDALRAATRVTRGLPEEPVPRRASRTPGVHLVA